MRRITLLCVLIACCCWHTQAQVLNQPAGWPNASWTLTGTYSPAGLASDPTITANFSFDDDTAGIGSVDNIAAESPVIDLTAAQAAGETWITVSLDYSYNQLGGDLLEVEYYDADAATWTTWPIGVMSDNASYNTYACGNTTTPFVTGELYIVGFTATQLSGFKYRIAYDDMGNWNYGFCTGAPTITSTAPPTCLMPEDLLSANETTTSADLSWNPIGGTTMWDIEIVEAGVSPTGTPTQEDVTTNPYTYTNLLPSTNYEFYVRADCGGGDTSAWAGPYAFTTLCDVVTVFPWNENFDTTTPPILPNCWSAIDNNGDGDLWNTYDFNGIDGSIAVGIYTDYNAGANDDYLILPHFNLTGNEELLYSVSVNSSNEPDEYEVLLSTTGNAPADFTEVLLPVTSVSSTSFEEITLDLSAYTGEVFIAIHVPASTTDGWYIYFDDFTVRAIPTCIQPTDLTATAITATSAELSWTAGDSETAWNVEFVATGTVPSGTPTVSGVTNPYIATLDPATDYDYYVQADCTGGDLSYWSGPYSFTTLCATFTPDFTENFDTFLPNCWERASTGDPTTGPSDFGSSSWISDEFLNTGSNMAVNINLYYNNKTEWLITPSIDLSGGATELTYMVATTDYNNSDPIEGGMMGTDDEVQVLISEDDGVTWANLMTYNATNTPSNTGDMETIDLSAYTGTVKIAFWATEGTVNDDSTYDYDFFLDDVAITATGGGGGTGGNCSQMQVSNNFENGYGIDENGGYLVADDFIVSSSTTNFSVESITGNFIVPGGIASMDVLFFTDNAGLPGTQIGTTIEDIVPTSQTVIGTAFSMDVYQVVLDLPTPVDFAGSGTADDATYWLQLVAVPTVPATTVYWEVTTLDIIGNSAAFTAADPIAWSHDASNPDAVFTIAGVCTYVACPEPIALTATPTGTTTADISWTEVGTATEWVVEYGAPGFVLGTGTVVADNDGTLGVSLSSLIIATEYEYYVTSICGTGSSYVAGPASFVTPICDPTTQCTYTFTLTDAFGDGWNGAAMEVRQNGYVIADLALTSGALAEVNVPICDGADFELYWTVPGAWDGEVGVSIINPFGIPIYTLAPGTVAAPASLYIGTGGCTPPSCQQPLNLLVDNIGPNSADLSWEVVTGATNGYVWYVFATGADPAVDTPVATGTTAAGAITAEATGLTPITTYDFYVKADCDTDGMSDLSGPVIFETLPVPPVNDNLIDAIALTINAPCSGDAYTNVGATVEANEPAGTCHFGTDAAQTTVWFSFVAPASGSVIISTDYAPAVLFDSQLALFEAPTDLADLSTLGAEVGCDEDNGETNTLMSIIEATGLTGGNTYYIQVDGYAGSEGGFCITVIDNACPVPTGLTVTGVGDDVAVVSWLPGASETAWDVEYGPVGFAPGTGAGTVVPVTPDPTTTLTGLTPATSYDVYVSANCGSDISAPVGPVSFTTFAADQCGQSQTSNGFENGLFMEEGGQLIANDFIVPVGTVNFSVESISANLMTMGGITSVDILFFEDNAGIPGTQIGATIEDLVPTSQDVIGTAFGYDVENVVLDLPTPIDFVGSTSGDVTYWVQLVAVPVTAGTQVAWEVTTASIIGYETQWNDGTGWTPSAGSDGVFTILGTCTYMGVNDQVFEGFTYYPNPVKNSVTLKATNQIQQVEVFNLLGQSVFKNQPNSMNPTLKIGELQAGAYLMKVTINGSVGIYRLIKE